MTTLNIRIEEKMKKKANSTLAGLGLDMSTAVKMFLNQVIEENGLPFAPTKNQLRIRARWDREIEEARNGPSYATAEEALAAIIEEKE